MTTLIRGDRYTIFLGTQHELNKIVPGSAAFIKSDTKEIYFSFENQELAVIRHELMHAYLASTYVHELEDLDSAMFEEIVCEVVGHHAPKLCSQAKRVKNAMKTLVEEWETNRARRIKEKKQKRKRGKRGNNETKQKDYK